jgi:uncharacterized UBP type Zn finger protein
MAENIKEYIKSNLERGLTIEVIKQNLLSRNYSDFDIDEAINEMNEEKFAEPETEPEEELDLD